jgi:protein-S-isoprenylcysteine O-methyltransferase Ste14
MRPDLVGFWLYNVARLVVFGTLLFGGAGTLRWRAGWVLIAELVGGSVLSAAILAKRNRGLLMERMLLPLYRGQPAWDRVYIVLLCVLLVGGTILSGLDAGRFHWSHVPNWICNFAAGIVCLVLALWHWTFQHNRFASTVVRVQHDRGHTVVDKGPYAFVRHPMYAGAVVLFPSAAIVLGSLYDLIPAGLLSALVVFRTEKEDRYLLLNLEGYSRYSRRVRFKLLPKVW